MDVKSEKKLYDGYVNSDKIKMKADKKYDKLLKKIKKSSAKGKHLELYSPGKDLHVEKQVIYKLRTNGFNVTEQGRDCHYYEIYWNLEND